MATGWVKSLHCISNALDDVSSSSNSSSAAPSPSPRGGGGPSPTKIKKTLALLPINCGNPSHTLKDVLLLFPKQPPPPPPPPLKKPSSRNAHRPKPRPKPNPIPIPNPKLNPAPPVPIPPPKSLPTLTDLPASHSSRRVVEIIFASSWSSRDAHEIEMLFRVHNPPRTVARFEDYRTAVRAAAEGASDARCAADGNEMMRFQCAPPSSATVDDAIYDARVVACAGGGIRTFAGSGGAHESVGGGGGRRSMLVCRVIAGRIRSGSREPSGRFESVSAGRGELLVFDPRAVLPCFLIIYRL